MKRYSVEMTRSAEADIIESFLWGCSEWGLEEAESWANELRTAVLARLSTFPLKYPVAPEDDHSGREYRQFYVGRYRVIFYIDRSAVMVTHVTGPSR